MNGAVIAGTIRQTFKPVLKRGHVSDHESVVNADIIHHECMNGEQFHVFSIGSNASPLGVDELGATIQGDDVTRM